MKKLLLLAALCCSAVCSFSQTHYREEFNGPFESWTNVKTRFKAAGNGIKDDTEALQAALDSLTCTADVLYNTDPRTRYLVIYLPAGTYVISQTLRLTGKIGVTFIGEDPKKTIIKWNGANNDTMFFSNRSAYVKVSRITWDANNKTGMEAVGFHYKDFNMPKFAPTSIELSDMIFTGKPLYGISGGTYASDGTGMMDAEFTIRRCKFYACSGAGIFIKGYNALDYWIWDCAFNACSTGVTCTLGNYHIYQCQFDHSTKADIYTKDAFYTSVRGCYSSNAAAFSLDEGASCNAFKRIFQQNFVHNCTAIPVDYHHLGKLTLMDNYFLNDNNAQPFTVNYASWCSGNYDILSINNNDNYAGANQHNFLKQFPSQVHSVADKKFDARSMKAPAVKPLPPFAPYVKRKIFEVPVNAGSAAIQHIINEAAALKGQRAVVHFPMGEYTIDKTLEVPAGSDIQLTGDGMLYASRFLQTGKPGKDFYYFTVYGPSYITLRDLQIGQDSDTCNAFLFTGIDQPAAQVRIDQMNSKTPTSLLIDKLDNTYFEKNNSFFSTGHVIIGGSKVKAGTGASRLYCFGGQSAGVHLENNATMVAKDCWWEGVASEKNRLPLYLSGDGSFTLDGAMYAPSTTDYGTVTISNFKGNVSLLNMYLQGSIEVLPNAPGLKMLVWNICQQQKKKPLLYLQQKVLSQIALMGIASYCNDTKDIKCPVENPLSLKDSLLNVPDVTRFITALTNDDRKAMPKPYVDLAAGVSNIYISRVSTSGGKTAYTFKK